MDARKKKRLIAAGWRVGSPAEFLGLTQVEAALVEVRLAIGRLIRSARTRSGLTQAQVAARLASSQSRVAKLEAGNVDVSLDLLVLAAFAAGASRAELASAFRRSRKGAA
jgi:DNA-binding XRE family transcriptional regulator